jgi:hypothetical protein
MTNNWKLTRKLCTVHQLTMPVCRVDSLDLYAGSAALATDAFWPAAAAAAACALAKRRDLWPVPALPRPAPPWVAFLLLLLLSPSSMMQLDSMVGVMGREVRTTSSAR